MGGLAVAARLATLGHRVTVCEQSDDVGGKLGWFARDGFGFDTGPSLLTLPAVYRDLFVKTGSALESEVELLPVDPVCHYRFADGIEVDLPERLPGRGDQRPGRGVRSRVRSRLGRLDGSGRRRSGTSPAGRSWSLPLDGVRGLLRESAQAVRPAHRRTLASLRAAGPRLPARPAPAHAARPLRDVHGVGPAASPGRPGHGALRGADLRRLVRPRRPAAARSGPAPARAGPGGDRADRLPSHRDRAGRLAGSAGCGSPTAAGCRPTSSSPTPTPAASTPISLRRKPSRAPLAQLRRATPSLSGFVLLLALRGRTPGLAHHTRALPRRLRRRVRLGLRHGRPSRPTAGDARPGHLHLRTRRPGPATRRRPRGWFVLVNAPRHSPDDPTAGIDWDAPDLATTYADRVLDLMAQRGLRRTRSVAVEGDSHTSRPRARHRERRRARSTAPPATAPARPSSARPTARRCRGCSSSAGRPIPEVACRSSGCRPRSWPSWSAGPERRLRPARRADGHDDLHQADERPCRRPRRQAHVATAPACAGSAPQPAMANAVRTIRVGRSPTVTTSMVRPSSSCPRTRTYSASRLSPTQATASQAGAPEEPQRHAVRRVGQPVAHRVGQRADGRDPVREHGHGAVQVVQQAGRDDEDDAEQRPPGAQGGHRDDGARGDQPGTVTTVGATPAAASGRPSV